MLARSDTYGEVLELGDVEHLNPELFRKPVSWVGRQITPSRHAARSKECEFFGLHFTKALPESGANQKR